jgi:uncharacterized membrane protein YfcA
MEYSDPWFLAAAVISALIIGLAKGGLALVGSLAVPILALTTSPVYAAALMLPILVASDMYGLWSYRKEFDARNLRILIPAGVLGIAIGWATASLVTDRAVGLVVGVVGVAFCINAWRRRHHPLTPKPADVPRGVFWGTLVGFTSFVSHSGGPPYQVYVLPQRLPKMIYAGTTTILQRNRIVNATPQQLQNLAAIIHLCGAGAGNAYARRGFTLTPGQRCGDHEVRLYLAKIDTMRQVFSRLRARDE